MKHFVLRLTSGCFVCSEEHEYKGTKYFKLIGQPDARKLERLINEDDAFIYINDDGVWLVL